MWAILGILVPLAIVVYFLLCCRRSPLALTSLAVVLTLGPAVYLHTSPIAIQVPFLPDAVQWRDLTMLALAVGWLHALMGFRSRLPGRLIVGLDTWVVLGFAALLVFEMIVTWTHDGSVGLGVGYAMRVWWYLVISLVMWVGILRRATPAEVVRYLDALAWLMVPLSALYCVSELGIAVNPYVGWASFSVGGSVVLRDTLTFPFFTPLALAWLCARSRQTVLTLTGEAVLLASCVLSYSRTIAAGAILLVAIVMVLRVLKSKTMPSATRSVVGVGVSVALAGVLLVLFAPGQASYAFERFAPSIEQRTAETNTANRLSWFEDGSTVVAQFDQLFGLGFGKEGSQRLLDYASRPGVYLGDFTWALVLFTFGWLGLTAYVALYGQYLCLACLNAFRRDAVVAAIPLALVGVAAYDVTRTWASAPWVAYPTASALALALLYVDRRQAWAARTANHLPLLRAPWGRDPLIAAGPGTAPARESAE